MPRLIAGTAEAVEKLDDKSLKFNVHSTKIILMSLDQIKDKEHLRRLCAEAFNILVMNTDFDKLTGTDAMKVNLLAASIDGGMELAGVKRQLENNLLELAQEMLARVLVEMAAEAAGDSKAN